MEREVLLVHNIFVQVKKERESAMFTAVPGIFYAPADRILCSIFLVCYIPSQVVENPEFIDLMRNLRPRVDLPYRRRLLESLREMKGTLDKTILEKLVDQHVSVTTDGWTSSSNDTYMSFTCSFLTAEFELEALCLECKKHGGRTTAEDLEEAVKAMIQRNALKGRVLALTTDCEPSMVKTGRLLAASEGITHIGCCCHRLESITSQAFNGPGVSKALALARAVVMRYTMSSQAADRLEQMCGICNITSLKVVQDVSTRWSSTQASAGRLLYLRRPITEHERIDNISPLLLEKDWEVLGMVVPLLEPFMVMQKELEASKEVTGSLVIPYMHDLRRDLDEAVDRLKAHDCPADSITAAAKRDVVLCGKALQGDFNRRWGDGHDVLTHQEGPRRQPCGFRKEQVLATAMDPRSKSLYGIDAYEHPDVWQAVADATVEIALHNKPATSTPSDGGRSGSPITVDPAPRTRRRGFAAAAEAHAQGGAAGATEGSSDSRRQLESIVERELESFKSTPGISLGNAGTTSPSPLEWWRVKSREYPTLALLARRVLCIPASQAQSERVFSAAGQVATSKRSCLDPDNVELMVFLRTALPEVDKWEGKGKKRKSDGTMSS